MKNKNASERQALRNEALKLYPDPIYGDSKDKDDFKQRINKQEHKRRLWIIQNS